MASKVSFYIALGVVAYLLTGCADINNPYPGGGYSGGYSNPHYNPYNDPYRYEREADRARHEQRELERERERLEEERRRLERERNREQYNRPPPPRPPVQDQCPPGFSPSERKCSPEERKRGCKDMRLPNGRGCVRR
ncbi:MAG: hypothetical protein DCC75_03485 [Proteobacteria bacterium]|nr:MAG: hypothetical protein DCC75_03485 [Pseudomonadota bacterium]